MEMDYKYLYETNELVDGIIEDKKYLDEGIDRPAISNVGQVVAYLNKSPDKYMKQAEKLAILASKTTRETTDALGSVYYGMIDIRNFLEEKYHEIDDSGKDPELAEKVWGLKLRVDDLEEAITEPEKSFKGGFGAMMRSMDKVFPFIRKEAKSIAKELKSLKIN